MNDVVDFERDFRRAKQGESLIYTTLHGLKPDLSQPNEKPELLEKNESDSKKVEEIKKEEVKNKKEESSEEDSDDDDDDDDDEEDDEDEEESEKRKANCIEMYIRPRDESPNSRKVNRLICNILIYFLNKIKLF